MEAQTKKKLLIGISASAGALLLAAIVWFLFFVGQFSTYNDKTYRFTMKYPSKWQVVVASQPGAAVAFVSPSETALDTFRENVNISIQDVPPELATIQSFSDKIMLQMKAVFGNINVAESKSVDFGKRKGRRVLFTALQPDKMHILTVWMIKGGSRAYILTFMSASDRFERYSPVVEEMIKSFELK